MPVKMKEGVKREPNCRISRRGTEASAALPCLKSCPAGNECCCVSYGTHHLHICEDEECYCHSQERYENNG
jgi:hypothetical protein